MERLLAMLNFYNSGAHNIDQLFDNLIELAKDLSEEEQQAQKKIFPSSGVKLDHN
jgi:hypothetical protein